jgi:hypothetical protein
MNDWSLFFSRAGLARAEPHLLVYGVHFFEKLLLPLDSFSYFSK